MRYSNRELAHVWAHSEGGEASGSNMFFRDNVIYSYGTHFPIAKRFPGVILFTSKDYSRTTAIHKSRVRSACYGAVYTVPNVLPNNKEGHKENVNYLRVRIKTLIEQQARALKYDYVQEINKTIEDLKGYCRLFNLRITPVPVNLQKIIDKIKENPRELKKELRTIAERKREKQARENKQKIKKWRAGLLPYLPRSVNTVLLRVVGDVIETSRSARFPISHGKKAYKIIKAYKTKGAEYERNGHTIPLGLYKIDRISRTGNVAAGCHVVKWEEINRIAKQLKW